MSSRTSAQGFDTGTNLEVFHFSYCALVPGKSIQRVKRKLENAYSYHTCNNNSCLNAMSVLHIRFASY